MRKVAESEKKDDRLEIRVAPLYKNRLRRVAEVMNMKVADVVRLAIAKFVEENEKKERKTPSSRTVRKFSCLGFHTTLNEA